MAWKSCMYCGRELKVHSNYITCKECGHVGCTTGYSDGGGVYNDGCGANSTRKDEDKCIRCRSNNIQYHST